MISIGVLTPHGAPGPEAEFPDLAGEHVTARVSRIPAPGGTRSAPGTPPTAPSDLRMLSEPAVLAEALASFPAGSVDVIAHASTSTGYAIGFEAEAAMIGQLSELSGLPVVATSHSAVSALRAFSAVRIALIHPPWFDDELNDLGARYFRSQGFDVIASTSVELPCDPSQVDPRAVIEWVSGHVGDDAEAVFIGGNGFRVAGALAQLEINLGRPVLESNQVLLWAVRAVARADFEVAGYGALFSLPLLTTEPG